MFLAIENTGNYFRELLNSFAASFFDGDKNEYSKFTRTYTHTRSETSQPQPTNYISGVNEKIVDNGARFGGSVGVVRYAVAWLQGTMIAVKCECEQTKPKIMVTLGLVGGYCAVNDDQV